MGFQSAALQALALGALAAYLTYAFTGPLGHSWQLKDYLFVLAVAGAVFYNRMTTMKYDTLIQAEYERRKQHGMRVIPYGCMVPWMELIYCCVLCACAKRRSSSAWTLSTARHCSSSSTK